VLAAVPVLISVSVKSSLSQPGRDAPDFFRSITDNGLFVALAALTIEIGLFLPLAVSVVAGDSVAGEANLGTLRYLLTVPVTRLPRRPTWSEGKQTLWGEGTDDCCADTHPSNRCCERCRPAAGPRGLRWG
jgi:hypothetical protein